jgi:hypothetical protein
MEDLVSILPVVFTVLGGVLVVSFCVLYLILRHHWYRYALNDALAKRVLRTYAISGGICSLGIVIGTLAFFAF